VGAWLVPAAGCVLLLLVNELKKRGGSKPISLKQANLIVDYIYIYIYFFFFLLSLSHSLFFYVLFPLFFAMIG
jgi:hypothetical protein